MTGRLGFDQFMVWEMSTLFGWFGNLAKNGEFFYSFKFFYELEICQSSSGFQFLK